ncbi:VTT domain-containing protein [Desulfitobacterium sp. THU1]|uniref:TVP38/TMEM64 family protein n=1 Tax=Desulfitobacterium sp. THU1 TaxID=3138072 RepID=UPI00311DD0A6
MKLQKTHGTNSLLLTLILVISIALIVLFFYLDRKNELSSLIQSWGIGGIFFAILIMAALCMTPIPSEGFFILLLKIFGVFWGSLYSWLGFILSNFAIYYLAHYYLKDFFRKLVTPKLFESVDRWIEDKGTLGLFFARLLPLPAHTVGYIAGVMPSVKLWPYVWTAAITIVPYYVGTALIYLGVAKSTWIWLLVGATALLVIWGISYFLGIQRNIVKLK